MKSPETRRGLVVLLFAALASASGCAGGDVHLGKDGASVATATVQDGGQSSNGANAANTTDSQNGNTSAGSGAAAATATSATNATGLLDPNVFFMGVHVNYDADTGKLASFVQACGFVPPVVAGYVTATADGGFELSKAESYVDDVVLNHGTELSLAITAPITSLSQTQLDGLRDAVTYGRQRGLVMNVRYGYEMNGNWSPAYHGGDASYFLAQWAQAEKVVHAAGGLMVWSPNVSNSGGYAKWMPDMATVDKVGLDMYHQVGDIVAGEVDAAFASIYDLVAPYNKPFLLTETGVVVTGDNGYLINAAEAAKKMVWLGQLTDPALRTKYPLYSGFVWFDYQKQETASGLSDGTMEWRNFSISTDAMAAALVKAWYPTVFATK